MVLRGFCASSVFIESTSEIFMSASLIKISWGKEFPTTRPLCSRTCLVSKFASRTLKCADRWTWTVTLNVYTKFVLAIQDFGSIIIVPRRWVATDTYACVFGSSTICLVTQFFSYICLTLGFVSGGVLSLRLILWAFLLPVWRMDTSVPSVSSMKRSRFCTMDTSRLVNWAPRMASNGKGSYARNGTFSILGPKLTKKIAVTEITNGFPSCFLHLAAMISAWFN